MSDAVVLLHPVQTNYRNRTRGKMPQVVTRKAYEVYRHVHGEQEALITGECRGGFGVGELIAFLYASSFPKAEWSARCREAFKGMDI